MSISGCFSLNNQRNIGDASRAKIFPVAVDFLLWAQRLGVIVRELNSWTAFDGVRFADEAYRVKSRASGRIAASEIVGQ